MNDLLAWIQTSAVGHFMRESMWAWPVAEVAHFIGLSLLMGSLLVIDLRLLRVLPNLSMQAVLRFVPLTLIGFAINSTTGALFFFGDPIHYYSNIAFRLKMLLVVLAGVNAVWFKIASAGEMATGRSEAGGQLKAIAALSLILWIGVIFMGRFIPYVEDFQ
jgi:hypothetical protein